MTYLHKTKSCICSFLGPQGQTCGALNWFQCTSKLDDCSVACNPDFTAASCGACLGETHDECVNCIPQLVAPNMTEQLSRKRFINDYCRCHITTHFYPPVSSCGPWGYIKCAVIVARCAATCSESGITSSQCITCFGSLYDQCKNCLPLETAVMANNPVQGERLADLHYNIIS